MSTEIERVAGLFAEEVLDSPVTDRDEVPRSYGAITDAWLTDVLCRDHPGAEVIAHRFDERDDGSSNRRRIMLDYNQVGTRPGCLRRFSVRLPKR